MTPLIEEKVREFQVVKRNTEKVDGKALVRGKPVYTDDFDARDELQVKLVRSPHAHAVVKLIDSSEARKIPGVVAVLTGDDFPRICFTRAGQGYPEPSPYDTFILDTRVRYVGDPVAIVAAKTEKAALAAVRAIKVEYEQLEAVLSAEDAMNPSAPKIHPEAEAQGIFDAERNVAARFEMEIGEIERVLEECDMVVSRTYHANTQLHAMLEPHVSRSYLDPNNRLVIVSSTQVPFHVRRILARIFSKPVSSIRVIKPRIGGGFGGKQALHTEQYVAAVTLATGRPARLVFTREEVSMATNIRHEMKYDVTVGASKDGSIKAISMQGLSNTGAYGEHALTTFMVSGSKTLPLYNKVDAVRFAGDVVYTNLPPAGAFRGYGAPQGLFALDCAIDELARELGMDPLYLKTQNSIREGESSPIFKLMGEGREGVEQVVGSCKLQECIDRGRDLIDWESRSKKPSRGKKVRGLGCALAMQGSGIAKIDMAAATIKMNEDGSFNLLVGATDIGTGSDTALAQIAAETLHVPVDKIIVYSSDTDFTPFDTGAYASSTTYVSGNAVKIAAEKVRDQIFDAASKIMEDPLEDMVLEQGEVYSKASGNSITLEDICTRLFYTSNQQQIGATGSFVGDESPIPFMATFAEVEVDLETGKVELKKLVSVADCGTPINPVQALGQLEGGTMQGIGWALYENVIYSPTGRMLTTDFFTYKVPSRLDYGELICELAESYEPTGPYGAKSIAEIGIDTPIPAIANAIYDATGIRLREAPFKSEKLLFEVLSREV